MGISIKPKTPVDVLLPYLDQAEMFLIMSVEPGFGGQAFIPESLERILSLIHIYGVNDTDEDAQELIHLLKHKNCHINLIPVSYTHLSVVSVCNDSDLSGTSFFPGYV